MKIKEGYRLRKVGNNSIVVAVGGVNFTGLITVNETGTFIWKMLENGAEPDEQSLLEAAMLAAYYSQGRESSKVPVDYTPVRYVKKPNGAKPGMVTYTTYKTMYVTPDGEQIKSLNVK